MKKPVIGITSYLYAKKPSLCSCVFANYSRCVTKAGGLPLIIPQGEDPSLAEELLSLLDGVLITGGGNVLPLFYGEQLLEESQDIDPDRDQWELNLTRLALEKNMPVLGVCRGLQIINIAQGGSLYQNINTQKKTDKWHMVISIDMSHVVHGITINKNTLLETCFKEKKVLVNSFHNQAVKDLGKDLIVSALSDDGLIEAVEMPGKNFVLGVQWHPESLTDRHPPFLEIFNQFVLAAKP